MDLLPFGGSPKQQLRCNLVVVSIDVTTKPSLCSMSVFSSLKATVMSKILFVSVYTLLVTVFMDPCWHTRLKMKVSLSRITSWKSYTRVVNGLNPGA